MDLKYAHWLEARQYTPEGMALARLVLDDVRSGARVQEAVRRHPLPGGGYLGKHVLVAAYRQLTASGVWAEDGHRSEFPRPAR